MKGAPMETNVRDMVKEKYGKAAERVRHGYENPGCCNQSGCGDPITSNLYDVEQIGSLPVEAVVASLGCGNPTALAELKAGESVLDLGSGGGIDVLLSARRVGPTGKAYGLDMTDEMLALARENQRKSGVDNVEFLKGEIEQIPVPDNSVDVIISNCVINLSADQRPRAGGGVSCTQTRRTLRGVRRRRAWRRAGGVASQHGIVDRLRGGRARRRRISRQVAACWLRRR